MRNEQNIVFAVSCVALISAIVFTLLHSMHGWHEPYPWLTSILVIVWIFAVLTLFRGFQLRTGKRREARRRFYLSPEWVYNHEIGYAPLSRIMHDSPFDFVMFAGNALAKMSYGFEVAEAPDDFKPTLLISSQRFTFHFIDDADDPTDRGVVVDKWAGSLQKVQLAPDGSRTYIRLGDFANATTLTMLLDTNGAFDLLCESDNQADRLLGDAELKSEGVSGYSDIWSGSSTPFHDEHPDNERASTKTADEHANAEPRQ